MADNLDITPGTGATVATDQVGTDHYQRVKLTDGAADSSVPINVDIGVKANALRVAPANDITDGVYIGDIKFGESLPAGTNGIGKLTANSGVDIGDVDVISVPAPLNVVGGGTEAAALRVTIANDCTGIVTVDGGVTANAGQNLNTSALSKESGGNLDTIAGDTTSLDSKVVACDTGAVVVASGAITESNSAAIKTALEIIDNWAATHAAAAPTDGVMTMGAGYSTGLPADIGADADAARICTDRFGRVLAGVMPQNFQSTFTSADATSAAPIKVKTASKKMYILSMVVSVDTAMNVQFQDDNTPTVLLEGMYFAANGGAHLTWPPESPLVVGTNFDFDVIASAAGNISVTITGYLAV